MSEGGLRVGLGVDAHRYARQDADRPAMIAGLRWPGETPCAGHSDGDAVAHAIVDAVASASGLGDIGALFGTDDPAWAGGTGEAFLRQTRLRAAEAGFAIVHISVVLIANRPNIADRRTEAEAGLSAAIGAPVTLSATTTDGLGLTGRGEGVAAIATALLRSEQSSPRV